MIIIAPNDRYSNFLHTKEVKAHSVDPHPEEEAKAKKRVLEDPIVRHLLETLEINPDTITLIRQDVGEYYYITYVKESPLSVVVDENERNIVGIMIDPKKAKRDQGVPPAVNYTPLIREFIRTVDPFPPTSRLTRPSSDEDDLYFIDTEKNRWDHLQAQGALLIEALKKIDEKIVCLFYTHSGYDEAIIAKSLPEAVSSDMREIQKSREYKKASDQVVTVTTLPEKLLYLRHTSPQSQLVLEIQNTYRLNAAQKDAIAILADIALTMGRPRQ